jgi:deoxycytidylate deaminase
MRKKYLILAKAYDSKGRLLSVSWNDYKKSHPVMKYFSEKANIPFKEYLHAEISAILKARDKQVHTLTVERYNKDGSTALAKPCRVCQEAIKAYGISVVKYTTDDGWEVERL